MVFFNLCICIKILKKWLNVTSRKKTDSQIVHIYLIYVCFIFSHNDEAFWICTLLILHPQQLPLQSKDWDSLLQYLEIAHHEIFHKFKERWWIFVFLMLLNSGAGPLNWVDEHILIMFSRKILMERECGTEPRWQILFKVRHTLLFPCNYVFCLCVYNSNKNFVFCTHLQLH